MGRPGSPAGARVQQRTEFSNLARLIDGFVLDQADRGLADRIRDSGVQVLVTQTVMNNLADKTRLARAVIDFAGRLAGNGFGRS